MDERSQRVAQAIRDAKADCAILCGFDNICYATGYVADLESGPSPFSGGPALAVVSSEGHATVVCSNAEEADASYAAAMVTYEGFSIEREPPRAQLYLDAVRGVLAELEIGGVVAVEPTTLPLAVAEMVQARSTGLVDIRPPLVQQRATKTDAEIDALRASAHLAGVGQQAAVRLVRAGLAEVEVFGNIRTAIDRHAGKRIQVGADLLSGIDRTAEAMGAPGDRVIRVGDPVICDLVPRLDGYWGDSCNTLQVGEMTPQFGGLYAAAVRSMETVVETLRPGISARDFDHSIRSISISAGYEVPLHSGHGIGCSNFEYPLIVPEEAAVLRPGMVLMVEPGAYAAGIGGARLEWMFLVTESGNEPLSTFAFDSAAG